MDEQIRKVDLHTLHPDVANIMQNYLGRVESMKSECFPGEKPHYGYFGLDFTELMQFLREERHTLPLGASYTIRDSSDGRPILGRMGGMTLRVRDFIAAERIESGCYGLN